MNEKSMVKGGEVERPKLSLTDFNRVAQAAQAVVRDRGQNYYGWVDPPTVEEGGRITHKTGYGDSANEREITPREAIEIYKQKLNGAYGERFITSLGTVAALIRNGYNVRFIQFQKEAGVPFDTTGWTVMVVEGMPIFHISPDDLRLADVGSLVEVLPDNNAPDVSWKHTNKVGEFRALLDGTLKQGLDLVKIAQEESK